MTEPAPRKPSALAVATDLLAPLVPRLLVAFAALRPGRPPQSLRALQPLALVLMLEAFGLAFLLTDEQRAAAWQAARGPGRSKADDDAYDPTDDSDETKALRWIAARAAAEDKAYRDHVRAVFVDKQKNGLHLLLSFVEFMQSNYAPSRAEFSRQWGERNPIDPATVPACFDPRAQLSILDAVSPERDGALGLFMAESRLRAEAPPVLMYMGHTLDLTGCTSLADVAWRAVAERWIVYLDHRGSTVGLRLLPPTDGIRVRLRAPLVNVLAADVEPAPSAPVEFGAFVPLTRLVSGAMTAEYDGQRLSLHGCRSITTAAHHAVTSGWSVKPCVRDGLPGLLFAPADRIVQNQNAHDFSGPMVDPQHEASLRDALLTQADEPHPNNVNPPSARTAEIDDSNSILEIVRNSPRAELSSGMVAHLEEIERTSPRIPHDQAMAQLECANRSRQSEPPASHDDAVWQAEQDAHEEGDEDAFRAALGRGSVVPVSERERKFLESIERESTVKIPLDVSRLPSTSIAPDLTIGDAVRFTSGPYTGRIAHVFEVSADKPKAQLVGRSVEIVDAIEIQADAVDVTGSDPDEKPPLSAVNPKVKSKKRKAKLSGVEGKARAKDEKRRAT